MSSGLKRTGRRSEATPFAGGRLPQFATVRELDLDAARYLAAVEAADGARLEPAVRAAVNAFVVGCKADNIWTPIKAACILAGARTLTGALVPLVGAAPTNFNFVAGDYSRKTGLVGNGSTKYLNSNRNNNADPQNSKHIAAYASTAMTNTLLGAYEDVIQVGWTWIARDSTTNFFRLNATSSVSVAQSAPSGFIGVSRSSGTTIDRRTGGSTINTASSSTTAGSGNTLIFKQGDFGASFSSSRLAFYSIGESLDLALLDSRVTTLINALAAALP